MVNLWLVLLWFPVLLSAHPFHVSVCDIHYNQEALSIEITHKIFLDDLENALRKKHGRKIDLLKESQTEGMGETIAHYLNDNFSIAIGGKKFKYKYLGHEIQADAIWCYQEIEGVEDFSEVSIKNTILFELFDDQTNLIHVKRGKKTKSLRLYPEKKKDKVKF